MLLRNCGTRRGQSRARHLVENGLARRRPQGELKVGVERTCGGEALEIVLRRLDVEAAPAPVVEGARDRTFVRMPCADIDVEPVRDVPQRPPEHDVLEVLRVGHEGHGSAHPAAAGC